MKKIIVLPEQKSLPPRSEPRSDTSSHMMLSETAKISGFQKGAVRYQGNSVERSSNEFGSNTIALEKEKQKRVITNTKRWRFTEEDYETENQLCLLKNIQTTDHTPHQMCVLQQLTQKISGYKSQDIAKNLYNPNLFVQITNVIELLIDSKLKCHYCKKEIKVLYEIVRDPLQWTLDRIDNDHGHNTGNLLIACLSCNLRRKTIYHERYEMTKLCTNVIKLS